jgi:hypothetical protein
LTKSAILYPPARLSPARTIANEQNTTIAYKDTLHPKPPCQSPGGQRLYNALFRFSMILVTTNYDVWTDERLAATGPRRHTNGTTSAPHNRTYERRVQARALLS